MKKSKVLCLGLAVTLVCSSLPQTAVQTYGETVVDAAAKEIAADVSGNSPQEEGAEETVVETEGLADEDGFEIDEDGVLIKYSGDATEVVIPDGVTDIGDCAFSECNRLTSITIPDSVTSIGVAAFRGCSGLMSITIPNSVTSIGDEAFYDCSGGLMSIKVEGGNTKYDSRENCNAIIETESNTLICGCKNTIIPSGVTSIGYGAFYNCSGLTSITVPIGVTSIGEGAFQDCSGLKDITISNSVTSIEWLAFDGCSGLASIKVESGNKKYDSRENCNAIIETETNTLIYGCKNTIIPAGVLGIGKDAFYDCGELTSIVIPSSVTNIEESAFYGCSGLTSITIPNSVTSIGWHAFNGCSGLTSIVIPSSVTNIEDRAFLGCSGLTSIKVENGNKKYDSRENCNAIIETETNTLICGCKNTIIPDNVTRIGNSAFGGCSGLTRITIPDSVTGIGNSAFEGCSGLTSITIPSSVTGMGYSAFMACSGLTSIRVEDGNTVYDSRENCNAIIRTENNALVCGCQNTIIPFNVTSIEFCAFFGCSELISITIPNSVTSIEEEAFGHCSGLTGITIPESVTSIHRKTFSGYENLTIYGIAGSYAESYAKNYEKYGIQFSTDAMPQPQRKSITDCKVTITPTSVIYNGQAQTVTVAVEDGDNLLKEGTDYTVAYSNNINMGTATVMITGIGRYTGSVQKDFAIMQSDVETNPGTGGKPNPETGNPMPQKVSQQLSVSKTTYDKAYGDKSFNLNVKRETGDGALTYKTSDKKVADVDANGKVTIKGTGSATITVSAAASANYNASPELKITVNVSPAKQTVKSLKTAKGRKLTVGWEKDTKATGYEIQCSTDKKFKKNVKKTTVKSNKTTSKTITKLTAGKKYYVRVRAYKTAKVNGKSTKLNGAWSGVQTSKKIKK